MSNVETMSHHRTAIDNDDPRIFWENMAAHCRVMDCDHNHLMMDFMRAKCMSDFKYPDDAKAWWDKLNKSSGQLADMRKFVSAGIEYYNEGIGHGA